MNIAEFRAYAVENHGAWPETVGPFTGPRGEKLEEVLKRQELGAGTIRWCYMPSGPDTLELDTLVVDGLCRQLRIPCP